MEKHTQTYWVSLGRGTKASKPNYPQSLISDVEFRDSAMRSKSTPVIIRVEFNQETGSASAVVEKNERFVPFRL